MKKFIEFAKLSKKKQKEINAQKRGDWGNVKPITKVKQSAKLYNRKKNRGFMNERHSQGNGSFLLFA